MGEAKLDQCPRRYAGARGIVEKIHERMPLVMHPRTYAAWLNPGTVEPKSLLMPFDDGRLRVRPVSTLVNDPRNDSPACIEPST
jgi:putative SOS response-associated peptidase YedK